MTTNSQLSTTKPEKNPKQITKTGMESYKWRSQGRLSEERGRGETRDKGTGKQYKWQVQNRQGDVKNSIGNGKA